MKIRIYSAVFGSTVLFLTIWEGNGRKNAQKQLYLTGVIIAGKIH